MNITKYPISEHINTNYKDYALYVLENRGIPSYYDALTNVQRIILQAAPDKFKKTISLVGSCFSSGYHHGDAALISAINKLTRTFLNANNLLEGDGFFGNSINTEAAAARYTSLKIGSKTKKIISENSFLHEKSLEYGWNPLKVDIPLGLVTFCVGIAVGYKTIILPRKLEDLELFYEGKISEVVPCFQNFTGTVTKTDSGKWRITGVFETNPEKRQILIKDIPPTIKYGTFLKKLNKLGETYGFTVINDSTEDLSIVLTKIPKDIFGKLESEIQKLVTVDISETIILIKDGNVLFYEKLEDYLEDFKYERQKIRILRTQYFMKVNSEELEFNLEKIKFLKYMLSQTIKTEKEILDYLKKVPKESIRSRLSNILLRSLNEKELKNAEKNVETLTKELEAQSQELEKYQKIFDKMSDNTVSRILTKEKLEKILDTDLELEAE